MRRFLALISAIIIFSGCATHKQLKPKQEFSSTEQGYIELKKDDDFFEIKQGKKYFFEFPGSQSDNFYLVLKMSDKKSVKTLLTDFYDGKKQGKEIKDETHDPDIFNVYPIERDKPNYYWMIDQVRNDLLFKVEYRYVPQWRFKFETRYAEFKKTFGNNLVDRNNYNNIGISLSFDAFDFTPEMDDIKNKSAELEKVKKALLDIKSVFPSGIVNSKDKAYLNYKELKSKIEEELQFQSNYLATLDFFSREIKSRNSTSAFLESVNIFIAYMSNKDRHPENVVSEAKKVMKKRLPEIVPYYDRYIGQKNDNSRIDPEKYQLEELFKIDDLYNACQITVPANFKALYVFVRDFNNNYKAIKDTKMKLKEISDFLKSDTTMPSNSYFRDIVAKMSNVQGKMPLKIDYKYGKYQTFPCTQNLNVKVKKLTSEVDRLASNYQEAENLVIQLNVFRREANYSAMLSMLVQKKYLGFLINKYKALDYLSLNEQSTKIRESISRANWGLAETQLRRLFNDNNFLDQSFILIKKEQAVNNLEQTLWQKINAVSRYRVTQFVDKNIDAIENIDSLYSDSAFVPAYILTFTSGSRATLAGKNQKLNSHLEHLKAHLYPERAIKHLYNKFLKNPESSKAVYIARAIVEHSKHYKGDEKKTKRRIWECNPWASKWITNPKKYRRLFAFPLTSKKWGVNRYFFRLNIRIPTEAKFPVYDVNIKLPKEIAKDAGTKQWYEKITLNKNLLKNEGRFRISAPTPKNNYECQITPMRVIKDQNNFLDIYFHHKSFKAMPISVMVQKPIIKKH